MQNLLILSPEEARGPAAAALSRLIESGYTVARTELESGDRVLDFLCDAFNGRPPDILLADLSTTFDCLPLRHAHKVLQRAWGDDVPRPASLALLTPRHLMNPGWLADVDDFLMPPYAPCEMLARIELLLFRKRHVRDKDTIPLAGITLDLTGGRALDSNGSVLPLTPREFDLLRFLGTHRGKFFARDRLLDLVWGINFEGGERTVDIHMRRLRAKLPPAAAALLETRRGVGYGLVISG